ncbi:arginine vasopressin-induced protein 1 isoform X2 [Xenopus laevis]|uniref:Arginine vasopressin-induced protein 1 n=2 Tax=Xenopus laevis TaxID=8355 RepID=A0A1L8FF30_XENLA|nr:arginine vasopressin-induced protein 1 isoform X2 [Xenopus laevis]OCT70157.1 hypothetical protein XELAEV_18037078mg [Xenopus laevis]
MRVCVGHRLELHGILCLRDARIAPLNQCLPECSEGIMGTPASVVTSPSAPWQGPVPRSRKKASANIFKDINLLQIQTLFRTSGDECAEERARIICEYAEDKRVAEALIRLRRKKRGKRAHRLSPKASNDRIGTLSVQHFSKLCINEADHKGSTDTEDNNPDQPSSTVQEPQPCETKKETATTRRGKGKVRKEAQERLSDYLHQIKR